MTPEHQRDALRVLCRLAIQHIDELPESDRPDVYEGVAIAAAVADPVLAMSAANIANDLRQCMASQLEFKFKLGRSA